MTFAASSITVVSATLLVDREIDFVTAMVTSVRAVIAEPLVQLVWAGVIGASFALSAATGFLALVAVFPVLGYSFWSMHRRLPA